GRGFQAVHHAHPQRRPSAVAARRDEACRGDRPAAVYILEGRRMTPSHRPHKAQPRTTHWIAPSTTCASLNGAMRATTPDFSRPTARRVRARQRFVAELVAFRLPRIAVTPRRTT